MADRLLIIDDDEATHLLLREAFEPHGWTVESVLSVEDAAERLGDLGVVAVLTDSRLARTQGQETVEAIVALTDLPIYVMTEIRSPELATALIRVGARDVFAKSGEPRAARLGLLDPGGVEAFSMTLRATIEYRRTLLATDPQKQQMRHLKRGLADLLGHMKAQAADLADLRAGQGEVSTTLSAMRDQLDAFVTEGPRSRTMDKVGSGMLRAWNAIMGNKWATVAFFASLVLVVMALVGVFTGDHIVALWEGWVRSDQPIPDATFQGPTQ